MMKLCGYRLTTQALGLSNAKYLTFDTPNTENPLTLDVLNAKKIYMSEQSHCKFGTIWTQMLKIKNKTNFIPFFLSHTHFSSHFNLSFSSSLAHSLKSVLCATPPPIMPAIC